MLRRIRGHIILAALMVMGAWGATGMSALASPEATPTPPQPTASAQVRENHAALVVRFGDGSTLTRCIAFGEPTISGAELLARSGLQIRMDYNIGSGGAVCSIDSQGCASAVQDCFCRCLGSQCEYWAYYHWADGEWRYSQIGAGSYQVADGFLEGWSWGPGNFSGGTEPPGVRFEDVCPGPEATAANTDQVQSGTPGQGVETIAGQSPAAAPLASVQVEAPRVTGSSHNALAAPVALAGPNPSESREFSRALLPGYVAYLATAAMLVAAGAWVRLRRGRVGGRD